jgi:hypothetical protein
MRPYALEPNELSPSGMIRLCLCEERLFRNLLLSLVPVLGSLSTLILCCATSIIHVDGQDGLHPGSFLRIEAAAAVAEAAAVDVVLIVAALVADACL